MIILAIDTSCDETCIAILKIKNGRLKIESNVISSQVKIHQKYGGVYPALAKREHQKNLVPVLKLALRKAKKLKKRIRPREILPKERTILRKILKRDNILLKKLEDFLKRYKRPEIDLIAVTIGPGLEPCLFTGVNFAKALGFLLRRKIVPINHIEAHIFANFIEGFQISKKQIFPAISLVVSGGHTELILMKDIGKYKVLGETRDDAAGECFDKVARILGLPYPGGPEIERLAIKGEKNAFDLPRPMIYSKDYDFSFAGLKTAVLYLTRQIPAKKLKNPKIKANIALAVQQAIIDVLISKTIKAAKKFKARTIFLGGGVVANFQLREQFQNTIEIQHPLLNIYFPKVKYCTDNAAMIGIAGYFNLSKKRHWREIKVRANLQI